MPSNYSYHLSNTNEKMRNLNLGVKTISHIVTMAACAYQSACPTVLVKTTK